MNFLPTGTREQLASAWPDELLGVAVAATVDHPRSCPVFLSALTLSAYYDGTTRGGVYWHTDGQHIWSDSTIYEIETGAACPTVELASWACAHAGDPPPALTDEMLDAAMSFLEERWDETPATSR